MQALHSIGLNYLYIHRELLDPNYYTEEDQVIVQLSKGAGCKKYFFRAETSSCNDSIKIAFEIESCVDTFGRYKALLLTDDSEKNNIASIDVTIYQINQ